MEIKDIHYLAALTYFLKFGQKRLKLLHNHFCNWGEAFKSRQSQLEEAGISAKIASEFIDFRKELDIHRIIELLNKENIGLLDIDSADYPPNLAELYDPPVLLYTRGNIGLLNSASVSVVGSRKISPYGQKATYNICSELTVSGLNIVSGLALGVDSVAHQACLDSGGRTIAVLGTGIDKSSVYPSSNRYLSESIIEKDGLIISEFPTGTIPNKFNFPLRNRIVAGLSLGTLVVEAAERSGALITARSALENNREVFALPGNIYSEVSKGPNELIRQGAIPVTKTQDILDVLDIKSNNTYIKNIKIEGDTELEKKILAVMLAEPLHIDEIVRATAIDTKIINSTLTIMEVKGYIKNYGGNKYSLK